MLNHRRRGDDNGRVGRYRYDGILRILESHVGPRQGHAVQAADLTQFDHIREARQWPSLCAAPFSPTRLHDARERPPRPFSEVFCGLLKVVAEVTTFSLFLSTTERKGFGNRQNDEVCNKTFCLSVCLNFEN